MIAMFFKAGGWIGLLPFILSAIILVSALIDPRDLMLRTNSIDGTGIITRKHDLRPGARVMESGFVSYAFTDIDGNRRDGMELAPRAMYDRIAVGDTVRVEFLPLQRDQNYRTNRLAMDRSLVDDSALLPIVVFFVIGLLTTGLFARRARRMERAWQYGHDTEGQIETRRTFGPIQMMAISFTDTKAYDHCVQILQMNERRHAELREGDIVRIRYDPQAPETAFWHGDLSA